MDKQDVKEMFEVLDYEDVKLIHSMIPEILEDKLIKLIKGDSAIKQDEFSNFLDMECEVTGFQTDYVKASTLYSFYERWCEANQAPILSKQDFKKKMTHNKNFKCKQKKENGKNLGLVYLGLKLNDVDDK